MHESRTKYYEKLIEHVFAIIGKTSPPETSMHQLEATYL